MSGGCVSLEFEMLSRRQASGVRRCSQPQAPKRPPRERADRRRGDSAQDGALGQIQVNRNKRSKWQMALGRVVGKVGSQEKGVLEMDGVTGCVCGRWSHVGTKGNLWG